MCLSGVYSAPIVQLQLFDLVELLPFSRQSVTHSHLFDLFLPFYFFKGATCLTDGPTSIETLQNCGFGQSLILMLLPSESEMV